jgi:hypothetical protein
VVNPGFKAVSCPGVILADFASWDFHT